MALFTLLCSLTLSIGMVHGRSGGPPVEACPTLRPVTPPSPHVLQVGKTGGYSITFSGDTLDSEKRRFSYVANEVYNVTLLAGDYNYWGFLIQSKGQIDGNTEAPGPIGTFALTNAIEQQFICPPPTYPAMTTVGHINNGASKINFTSQRLLWTAPGTNGYVDFTFTVVQRRLMYYGPLSAAEVAINRPTSVTTPVRKLEDYKFQFRHRMDSDDCVPADCKIFVGINKNAGDKTYLDIYIEATAEAWVGVGFSENTKMFDADVVACNIVTGTTAVVAADTWNGPEDATLADNDQTDRTNMLDTVQDVSLFTGSLVDGRLKCTITRKIVGTIIGNEDLDLTKFYYIMYGWGNNKRPNGALAGHAEIPTVTQEKFSVGSSKAGSVATTPLVLALLAALFVNKGY